MGQIAESIQATIIKHMMYRERQVLEQLNPEGQKVLLEKLQGGNFIIDCCDPKKKQFYLLKKGLRDAPRLIVDANGNVTTEHKHHQRVAH